MRRRKFVWFENIKKPGRTEESAEFPAFQRMRDSRNNRVSHSPSFLGQTRRCVADRQSARTYRATCCFEVVLRHFRVAHRLAQTHLLPGRRSTAKPARRPRAPKCVFVAPPCPCYLRRHRCRRRSPFRRSYAYAMTSAMQHENLECQKR